MVNKIGGSQGGPGLCLQTEGWGVLKDGGHTPQASAVDQCDHLLERLFRRRGCLESDSEIKGGGAVGDSRRSGKVEKIEKVEKVEKA